MHTLWKFLLRVMIAFSPSIFLLLGVTTGLIRTKGRDLDALATAVALAQGVLLIPFMVWMWVDFRRHPEKYPAPGWLIRALDIVPLGFIALAIAYGYLSGHRPP